MITNKKVEGIEQSRQDGGLGMCTVTSSIISLSMQQCVNTACVARAAGQLSVCTDEPS